MENESMHDGEADFDDKDDGVEYECQRCTNCCRWPGFVRLSDAEIIRISSYLGISEFEFIQRFTQLRPQRNGLALVDNEEDGACIFLDGNNCSIQSVKPQQCRDFPNRWRFPGWRSLCQAIPMNSELNQSSG